MTQRDDTIPVGLCQCGCGQKTTIAERTRPERQTVKGQPIRYIRWHRPRLFERPFVACVVCGVELDVPRYYVGMITTCPSPECRRERRRRASTGIDRMGVRHEVTCACGCGTTYLLPTNRFVRNKTGIFYRNPAHRADWERRRREGRGINTSGVTRYGPDWRALVKTIRARDKVCRRCGKTPEQNRRALDVHHVIPFRGGGSNDPSNLVTLCRPCHGTYTGKEPLPPLPVPRRPPHTQTCVICGATYRTQRANVVTCSEVCRETRAADNARAYYHRGVARDGQAFRDEINAQRQARRRHQNAPVSERSI